MPTAPSAPTAPRLHAVVIGVDKYSPLVPSLRGCVNDAMRMRQFLLERVQVPPSNLHLLASPHRPEDAPGAELATGDAIRALFTRLAGEQGIPAGDHLVLFYAGHGTRFECRDVREAPLYGFLTADFLADSTPRNAILGRELYAFLRALQERGVDSTVIADTCHAGAAMRAAPDGRAAIRFFDSARMTLVQWKDLLTTHPAFTSGASGGTLPHGGASRYTLLGDQGRGDFVFLAACQHGETAKESNGRGLLTLSLLDELERVAGEGLRSLTWREFFDRLRTTVADQARPLGYGPQTPACEGPSEKTLFGGAWTPYDPGFTVNPATDGVVRVEAGELHGLSEGAVLAIYPPGTARFLDDGAEVLAHATVTSAEASVSLAAVQTANGLAPRVPAGARARLVRPGLDRAPVVIRLPDGDEALPEATRHALELAVERSSDVTLLAGEQAATGAAHGELRRWMGPVADEVWDNRKNLARGTTGSWVLVSREQSGAPTTVSGGFTENDIVAYCPYAGADITKVEGRDTKVGIALAVALEGWGRYLRMRGRHPSNPALSELLTVRLRAGEGDAPRPTDAAAIEAAACIDAGAGVTTVVNAKSPRRKHWLWAEIIPASAPVPQLAWVLYSDDGNVTPLWPIPGQVPDLAVGRPCLVGFNAETALTLTRRADQTISRYTLRLLATTQPWTDRLDLAGLRRPTVQQVFLDELSRLGGDGTMRGGHEAPVPAAMPSQWWAWDFHIDVTDGTAAPAPSSTAGQLDERPFPPSSPAHAVLAPLPVNRERPADDDNPHTGVPVTTMRRMALDDKTTILIEVEDAGSGVGSRGIPGVTEAMVQFGDIGSGVRKIAESLHASLFESKTGPNEVTVKFGIQVSAEGGIIMKAKGEASIEITMTWSRPTV